jgi:hypothetical protein
MPTIGIFGLFDGKGHQFKKGNEKDMLAAFKKAYEAGEFDSFIKLVDKKRSDNAEKLAKARAKIAKK